MVFDEIDNGVGGKTANAIGRRLLEISKNEQIFAITHSPQVAALADTHFKVQKGVLNNETFSTIVEIDDNDRIEEIARMLSGNSLTEEARKMAKELKPLNLEYAKFRIDIIAKAPSLEGKDDVSFAVATNTGSDYGLLTKIASGGELSRFTLAMKVCLSQKNVKPILIFDEIDNGVGGKTANAIGRRLLEI